MKRLLALVAVLVLATAGGARAQCYPPDPASGSAFVNRSRVAPGECVVFSGNGFRPRSTVSIADNGAPRGTAAVDATGAFSTTVCFGSDAQPGQHVLTATGPSDGQDCGPGPANRTVSASVYVLGAGEVDEPEETDQDRGGGGKGGNGVGGVGAGRGGLPRTGDITFVESVVGVLLVLLGGAVLIAARPRRRSASAA